MSNLTNVHLLNVPIEADYKNTFYFDSKDAQTNYFTNRIVHSCTDASYQRKEKAFRINKNVDSLYNCNYVMFQNSAFSDKWFYAFITDLEYRNEETTFVHFEIDVMQTWLRDYTIKPSFVEREHVDDDTIGLHTVPEGLETGEYICNTKRRDTKLDDLVIVIASTYFQATGESVGGLYDGIYSGVSYYYAPQKSFDMINDTIKWIDEEGKADAVQCVFMAPEFLVLKPDEPSLNGNGGFVEKYNSWKAYSITYEKNFNLNGYTEIRNNKLKTYPYNYLLVSNNNGASAVYQYEHFEGDSVLFSVNGALTPGCSIRLIPSGYKGATTNDDEGLNLGKYPICNWNSDAYTNWLTQNGVNIATSILIDAVKVGAGAGMAYSTSGAMGTNEITSGVTSIVNTLSTVYQHSLMPPQNSGNTNCGDVITSMGRNSFHFYGMSIKKEYAEIIDGFFDMFGYKVSKVKLPNSNHRKNYWYTKTIGVNIDGAIPNNDLQKIKSCYNAGITFWRSDSDVGNYSVDNSIIVRQ